MHGGVSSEASGQTSLTQSAELGLSLLCRAQTRWCALPLRHVIETMRPLPTSPIPGMPAFVEGLALVRDRPIPVVNLSRLLGATHSAPTRFVHLRSDREHFALAVDEVHGVRSITSESPNTLPSLLQCADAQVVSTIGTLDRQLLFVMQIARLVPEEVWTTLASQATSA